MCLAVDSRGVFRTLNRGWPSKQSNRIIQFLQINESFSETGNADKRPSEAYPAAARAGGNGISSATIFRAKRLRKFNRPPQTFPRPGRG